MTNEYRKRQEKLFVASSFSALPCLLLGLPSSRFSFFPQNRFVKSVKSNILDYSRLTGFPVGSTKSVFLVERAGEAAHKKLIENGTTSQLNPIHCFVAELS